MKNTLFVPGFWFNPAGPIGQELEKRFILADLCGQPTLKARVKVIVDMLKSYPDVTTLIGHSGGCIAITEALKCSCVRNQIKQIILMNSGPAKGVKFNPFKRDATFWTIPKYWQELITGQPLMLSESDIQNLLMTEGDRMEEMLKNLKPDSGRYIRSTIAQQLQKKCPLLIPSHMKLAVINARNDRMIGSTIKETTRLYRIHNYENSFEVYLGEGHMWALQNIDRVLQTVKTMS